MRMLFKSGKMAGQSGLRGRTHPWGFDNCYRSGETETGDHL